MADIDWKYKIIPKIFNSEELDILKEYTKIKHFSNINMIKFKVTIVTHIFTKIL